MYDLFVIAYRNGELISYRNYKDNTWAEKRMKSCCVYCQAGPNNPYSIISVKYKINSGLMKPIKVLRPSDITKGSKKIIENIINQYSECEIEIQI